MDSRKRKQQILGALASGPLIAKCIAWKIGLGVDAVKIYLKELEARGDVCRDGKKPKTRSDLWKLEG